MTWLEELKRIYAICKKDIRIYYSKGPVVIFGLLIPFFLYLAFYIGREIQQSFLIQGMLGMSLFFTSTSVIPVIIPWESRMKTLERLISAPVSVSTILLGDILASFLFGVAISVIPLVIGVLTGVKVVQPLALLLGVLIAAFCFSSMAAILSVIPTDVPANVMMLSSLIKFPLIFISGVFTPLEAMPFWGRALSLVSPLTYFMDVAKQSFEGKITAFLYLDLSALLLLALIFLIIAIKMHEKTMPKRL